MYGATIVPALNAQDTYQRAPVSLGFTMCSVSRGSFSRLRKQFQTFIFSCFGYSGAYLPSRKTAR